MGKSKPPRRITNRGSRKGHEGRPLKPVIVFAAEGKTERSYLHALNEDRYDSRFAFKFAGRRDQSSLSNLVESLRQWERTSAEPSDAFWIVCDRDQNECHKEKLDKWIKESKEHYAAISVPCIEYWFLLHIRQSIYSVDALQMLKEFEVAWEEGSLKGVYKKGGEIPSDLIGLTDVAVKNALCRHCSLNGDLGVWSSRQQTDMPELISVLDKLDPVKSNSD